MTFLERLGCGVLLVLSLAGCQEAGEPEVSELVVFKDRGRTWTYEDLSIHGWTIYLEESIAADQKLKARIQEQITIGLENFLGKVPEGALAFLRTIPIWVSNEPTYPLREKEYGVVPFHRSPQWLRDHGLNPHMAPGVHVINPAGATFVSKP